MTHARWLIAGSPLLPALAYAPLAQALTGRDAAGRRVECAVATPPGRRITPASVRAALTRAIEASAAEVVIAHSNSGLYASALAGTGRRVLFMDASLPPPGADRAAPAPAALLAALRTMAGAGGLLPPWTRWWPEEDVLALFASATQLTAVRAAEVRLPLGYFTSVIPVEPGWERFRCAYLAFGGTYAAELARARAAGWPWARLQGGHLHHLRDPAGVADALTALASDLADGQHVGGAPDRHATLWQ